MPPGPAAHRDEVCESTPSEPNWLQSAPLDECYAVHIPLAQGEECLLDFGNICLGDGGARSPGFWTNRNGGATFLDRDFGASTLVVLRALDLWNADGRPYDPISYGDFKGWIIKRTAVNMA